VLHTYSHRCYISSTTFFAKPNLVLKQMNGSTLGPPNVIRLSKIIFLLLNQNTFLLPQPSFFYSHPPRVLWKSHDIINIIIILYCFFNHATLDISALFIIHTHIIIIIIFFNHATSGVSVMGHFSKRKSHINDLPKPPAI
jgi:hypothetical protein